MSGLLGFLHAVLFGGLCVNYDKEPEKAQQVQNFIGLAAFTESLAYPLTAKYHMNTVGVPMSLWSRSRDHEQFTKYQRMIVDDMIKAENDIRAIIK